MPDKQRVNEEVSEFETVSAEGWPVWVVIFKDMAPFYNSLSRSQKGAIRAAKDYFGATWKQLKSRGMRCVLAKIDLS